MADAQKLRFLTASRLVIACCTVAMGSYPLVGGMRGLLLASTYYRSRQPSMSAAVFRKRSWPYAKPYRH